MLCLDESREVHEEQPEKSTNRVTVPSILDGYIQRPCDSTFEDIMLLLPRTFVSQDLSSAPTQQKIKTVSIRPRCSSDPNGPK